MRNRARPFPMTSIRSAPATSVQPAGTDLKHPPSSWKYTRSPFQSWRCSKTSSTRPFQGWNGCVTRHRHTSSVGSGVVNTCFLDFVDELRPSLAPRVSQGQVLPPLLPCFARSLDHAAWKSESGWHRPHKNAYVSRYISIFMYRADLCKVGPVSN